MAKPLSVVPSKSAAGKGDYDALAGNVADLNRVIHEPARLCILSVLANCDSADFVFLERSTGLTKGNLWVQLARLEEAGLVRIEKVAKRPNNNRAVTTVSISAEGRSQLTRYWIQMEEIRAAAGARNGAGSTSVPYRPDRR